MHILHVHQDYPDGRPYPYTKAVENLINGCKAISNDVQHTVLSINRTSNPFKIQTKQFEEGISVVFWAIPIPFIFYVSMWLSSIYICKHLKRLKIDLVHGHKLTSEGVFVYFICKKFNKPYVVSVRGGSDMHNLRRLKLHTPLFKRVFVNAQHIFWVSAWAKTKVSQVLFKSQQYRICSSTLPNICKLTHSFHSHGSIKKDQFITVMSYHQYKRKGLFELVQAISQLKEKNILLRLDVYGTGSQKFKEQIERLIQKHGVERQVILKGQVTQSELYAAFRTSKGFVLPSKNETFGMAYIEALSNGCPILYTAGTGIDGYFDDSDIGIKLVDLSVEAVKEALIKMMHEYSTYAEFIKTMHAKNNLNRFKSDVVSEQYLKLIHGVCND